MTLGEHVALTGAAAIVLVPFVGWADIALFAVGGILIDIDHYPVYVQRRRRLSLAGMFRYYDELDARLTEVPYFGVCIFHTVEFFLLVTFCAFLYPPLFILLAGMFFHFCLDLIYLRRLDIFFIRAYSLVEHVIRRRQPGYPFH